MRNAIRKYLGPEGYEVLTATGEEALDVVRRQKVTGMLLDVNLPGTSGIELVPRAHGARAQPRPPHAHRRQRRHHGRAVHAARRHGLPHQADRPRPPRPRGRSARSQRRHTPLEDSRSTAGSRTRCTCASAELRLEQATQERISVATLEALVNALEAKDAYLRGHSARVADLSAGVAAELGRSDEEVEMVRTAGRLHDIGKIGIREEVLNKQGPLTDDEYEHVKQHVLVGCQILAPLVHLGDVISFVRSHHERWDGFGYPDRLDGEAIPLGARIVGAVEIFDALTTSRPYQEECRPRSRSSGCATWSARSSTRRSTARSRRWCTAARRWSSWTTLNGDVSAPCPVIDGDPVEHNKVQGRRIAFLPHPVTWTEVPETLDSLRRQCGRWYRGLSRVPPLCRRSGSSSISVRWWKRAAMF